MQAEAPAGPPPLDLALIVDLLGDVGRTDIAWAESLGPPATPEEFATEAIFVICNSGMRFTVARGIFERVMPALRAGASARTAFGHPGKSAGIDRIWTGRAGLHAGYVAAADKLAFIADLPWVGGITKYHLAKNFGLDLAKPDVHLQRLADLHGVAPQALCERLAAGSGYRVATVDTLLWRACATAVLCSRTGRLAAVAP